VIEDWEQYKDRELLADEEITSDLTELLPSSAK